MTNIHHAVFLDRDGTIIEDAEYLSDPEQVKLLPGSARGINIINKMGLKSIIVTNQSGVARGYFNESVIQHVQKKLEQLLEAEGARVDAMYYCPHHPTSGNPPYLKECNCRKPNTGMIDAAVEDLSIDPRHSYVIGDKAIDIELAHHAGAKGILVKTGYGKKEIEVFQSKGIAPPDYIAEDLLDAANWIKRQEKR